MVRVLTMCLSFALIVFGLGGLFYGAPLWLVVLDFVGGGLGLALDGFLWATQGRFSIIVAFAMSVAMVVLFFAAIVTGATPWLSWCTFGVGAAFFAIGCARAFSPSMYGGDLEP